MKICVAFAFASMIAASTVFGGEIVDGTHSVVAQAAPTPAVVVGATACHNGRCRHHCANGQCGTRLYSVDESSSSTCRNRLFGGTVVRKSSRTVLRPVR